MYKRYIGRCKDSGLIFPTQYRGTYEVNPFFVAKGKWDSIKALRATFDFVNGKWTRHLEEEAPETTPPQEPKKPQKLHKGGFDSYPDTLPGQMEMSDYAV